MRGPIIAIVLGLAMLGCGLALLFAQRVQERDTSAYALCRQVGLVNSKSLSDTELPQDCEQRVERIRALASPGDFRTYGRCLWNAGQHSDIQDCHEPFTSDLGIWGPELRREITNARAQVDESLGDLVSAKTDEKKRAAMAKRSAAMDAQMLAREKLQRLQSGIGGPLAPPLGSRSLNDFERATYEKFKAAAVKARDEARRVREKRALENARERNRTAQ